MQRELRFQIPKDRAGQSLVNFLAARFPYHTAEGWRERVVARRVRVNGKASDPDYRLATGDALEYAATDVTEPRVNLDVQIVHDDRDILVVNKPPNLPVHPGGRYFNHTLWAVLKQRFGLEAPLLVNRLDRETSGLVVVARTEDAARNCRKQFADRRVEKRYTALVEGRFPEKIHAAGWLTEDGAATVRKKRLFLAAPPAPPPDAPDAPEGEWAETDFRLLAVHGPVSEVEIVPLTGRLHQIRAVLHALGFPVVGDKLYGPDPTVFLRFCQESMTEEDRRLLRLDRQALHAAGLRFRHPRYGKPLAFDLPLPPDMATLVAELDTLSHGS